MKSISISLKIEKILGKMDHAMIVDKMDANYFNSMLNLFEKAWLDIERLINKDSLPRYRSMFDICCDSVVLPCVTLCGMTNEFFLCKLQLKQ